MSHLFAWDGQSIGASASALPMSIQGWFPLGWTALNSLQSKALLRVFSSTQFESIHSSALSLLYDPTLMPVSDTGRTTSLTIHHFADRSPSSQRYGFSSGYVWMVSWIIRKAEHWRIDAFDLWCWRRLSRVPWTERRSNQWFPKEINPKGNQSSGRTDAEAETPIIWPPDAKYWLIRKYSDAGKEWRQEEKGTTEDEMVGWHHWLNGHEFEQTLGVGDEQGSLVCCSPWCCKESGMTEWLNWTDPL